MDRISRDMEMCVAEICEVAPKGESDAVAVAAVEAAIDEARSASAELARLSNDKSVEESETPSPEPGCCQLLTRGKTPAEVVAIEQQDDRIVRRPHDHRIERGIERQLPGAAFLAIQA